MDARIIEDGNGFPDVGDYVPGDDGQLYRVVSTGSNIHTTGERANWITAQVEEADWDDCSASMQFQASVKTSG